MKRLLSLVLLFLGSYFCVAQNDSISVQQIDTVFVQVQRIPSLEQQQTAAISTYRAKSIDGTRQQIALQEYVQQIPGVFTQNANNFAQDLRISIRGFGARSSFGIRGVKLIVDGIPETTPDGQGQLDNINLGIIDGIEVLKGPSSSLYGNASGGVIHIKTQSFDTLQGNFSNWKTSVGSYNFQNYQVTAGIGNAAANYIFHANYGRSDGYRDQSGFEQVNTNFKGAFRLRENINLTAILNYSDSPFAEDAGGLTLEEVAQDRRQARQNNINFATQEEVRQLKAGLNLYWKKSKTTQIDGYAFYSNRNFNGFLPFEFGGVVALNRNYLGQGASFTYKKKKNTLQAGYDFGYQNDARERFRNLEGAIGAKTLDQNEKFTNLGLYVLDHYNLGRWFFTGGLRFDYNKLEAEDDFLSNGDDSGSQTLNAINPSLGLSYALHTQNAGVIRTIFANFSTSFETPGLSELSANPTDEQGFNKDLEPQEAKGFELGLRGSSHRFRYQLTLFYIQTQDELIPFELEAFPDRDFFRNAGTTDRLGVELEGSYAFAKAWKATFSYAYSNFKVKEAVIGDQTGDFFLAGIPEHNTSLGLLYAPEKGFHASLTANLVGRQFAQDENLVEVEGYELLNFRAGYVFHYRKATIRPYLGMNNVLNQEYTDNVRINAFGGRFFEPAPKLAVFGGLVVQL